MAKEIIKVDGMSCEHCVKAVKGAASEIAGVTSVDVDLDGGSATVEFDPAIASLAAIKAAIEEQGYDVA
jgi:copper chaperone